jgi:uncharacterized DUF497 family protein
VRFEWDRRKEAANRRKHGVRFNEATTVFSDRLAAIFDDEAHSVDEHREILIGYSVLNRLLLVCFTQSTGDLVRIYSARRATRRERMAYEEHWRT